MLFEVPCKESLKFRILLPSIVIFTGFSICVHSYMEKPQSMYCFCNDINSCRKANNRPLGENSPNLVTLILTNTFKLLTVPMNLRSTCLCAYVLLVIISASRTGVRRFECVVTIKYTYLPKHIPICHKCEKISCFM
jgi:hypothetical protein